MGRQVRVDAQGQIADKVLCHRCQYDLRGSSVVGRCPECGRSIVAGDPKGQEMIAADLRDAERGVRYVAIGFGVPILVIVATRACVAQRLVDVIIAALIMMGFLFFVSLPFAALSIYGLWVTTRRMALDQDTEGLLGERRIARHVTSAAMVLSGMWLLLVCWSFLSDPFNSVVVRGLDIIGVTATIAGMVGTLFLGRRGARLACSIGAMRYRWLFALSGVMVFIGLVTMAAQHVLDGYPVDTLARYGNGAGVVEVGIVLGWVAIRMTRLKFARIGLRVVSG